MVTKTAQPAAPATQPESTERNQTQDFLAVRQQYEPPYTEYIDPVLAMLARYCDTSAFLPYSMWQLRLVNQYN